MRQRTSDIPHMINIENYLEFPMKKGSISTVLCVTCIKLKRRKKTNLNISRGPESL